MVTIRCSALPRIFGCPASIEKPDVIIDTTSDAARMGTAAHEFYAKMVSEGFSAVDGALIWDLACKYNVDDDELQRLCWNGVRLWGQIKESLQLGDAELELSEVIRNTFRLSGHVDYLTIFKDDYDTVVVVDWKSGRKESDPLPQEKGYGLCVLAKEAYNANLKFKFVTVWTRLNIIETVEVTADDLIEFEGELMDIVTAEEKRYNPSDSNCVFCPLRHDCQPRLRYLQASGGALKAIVGDTGGEVTPLSIVALYPQYQMVMRVAEDYKNTVRQVVEEAGGSLGNLSFKEEERREVTYDHAAIAAVLGEDLPPHKVTKADLKKMVDQVAPVRGKGKLMAELLASLEAAGKVKTKTVKKLEWKEKDDD